MNLADHFIWHYAKKKLNMSHILWNHFPAHPQNTQASLSLSVILTPHCGSVQRLGILWSLSCHSHSRWLRGDSSVKCSHRQLQNHNRHQRWIFLRLTRFKMALQSTLFGLILLTQAHFREWALLRSWDWCFKTHNVTCSLIDDLVQMWPNTPHDKVLAVSETAALTAATMLV